MCSAVCWWMWIQRLLWGGRVTGTTLHCAGWTSKSTACSAGGGIALGLAWDVGEWKEQRKEHLALLSELCMLSEWLLLVSEVSTFRVSLRKFGSNSGSECLPAQRVCIFSKQVWDTELLFVSSKDCFNDSKRLWAGSSHYSPSVNHRALCTSGAVKRAAELVLFSCSLKFKRLLRIWKSQGHHESLSQAGLS